MKQALIYISLIVEDYDEAIKFYVGKLNFTLIEDTWLSDVKRWVLVQPPGSPGCCLLLAKAADEGQRLAIGNQSGGRVFLFLSTHDFDRDYNRMMGNCLPLCGGADYGELWNGCGIRGSLRESMGPDSEKRIVCAAIKR